MSAGGGLPRPARVRSVAIESARVRIVTLDMAVDAVPGQFVMLWLPGLDEKPFSIMADRPLALAVAAVGPFSRAVHRLVPGDMVWVRGPLGTGFAPIGQDHLLVGGGYGVAPLLFLAGRLGALTGRLRVVEGARTAADLILVEQLAAAGAAVTVATDDGSRGIRGTAAEAVEDMIASDPPSALYACGPHGMLVALRRLAGSAGIPAQLSWEAYMRCAVGLCGSCEHEGRLLCSEGPVLPARVATAPPPLEA